MTEFIQVAPQKRPLDTEGDWTVATSKKLRKLAKATAAPDSDLPSLHLDGVNISKIITTSSFREGMLWCLGDGINPKWLLVKNRSKLKRLVFLHIPHLSSAPLFAQGEAIDPRPIDMDLFTTNALAASITDGSAAMYASIPILQRIFKHAIPVRGPGDRQYANSPAPTFLNTPLTKAEHKDMLRKKEAKEAEPLSLTQCCATADQMIESDYPMAIKEDDSMAEWVATLPRPTDEAGTSPKQTPRVFAIDCEMCKTEKGSELTRISCLDMEGNQIMDELVKPDLPILDYVTRYSGITPEMMEPVTTTLADIQKKLLDLIHTEDIILGHSLNSDLCALKMIHHRVIDTSLLYQHAQGPPYRASLKWLANKYLLRQVQVNGASGHDSIEDAQTCVDLLKMKLAKGRSFGMFDPKQMPVFERLASLKINSAMIDTEHSIRPYHSTVSTAIPAADDDAVVAGVSKAIRSGHKCTYARLLGLSRAWDREDTPPYKRMAKEVLEKMDADITKIWEALPVGAAFFLTSGMGDTRELSRLVKKSRHFNELYATTPYSQIEEKDHFTDADSQEMHAMAAKARIGVAFVAVKGPE